METPGSKALLRLPLKAAVWELKRTMLETALHKAKYNQKNAARLLGLSYHQFRGLYRQYKTTSNT
jgi:psp operon transcriptional activator